jgi:hypothetical protein
VPIFQVIITTYSTNRKCLSIRVVQDSMQLPPACGVPKITSHPAPYMGSRTVDSGRRAIQVYIKLSQFPTIVRLLPFISSMPWLDSSEDLPL